MTLPAAKGSLAGSLVGVTTPWLESMDAGKDEELDRVFEKLKADFGTIDFLVHSIAFAEREWLAEGKFHQTPRAAYLQAIDISAYTYAAMARRAADVMGAPASGGGAMVTMSYYGAEKAVPGYNVMGVAKAALESAARYLALELGPRQIRVNSLSAGPVRTLSAMAVGGIDEMFEHTIRKAPMKRNIEPEEVGRCAVYLLSDLSTGTTGQTIYVDSGFNIVGL